MLKRRDIVLIACVLALAAALYGGRALVSLSKGALPVVRVYVGGKLYASQPLQAGGDITVTQPGGAVNVIRMTDEGFFMASSTCANQLCVHQGAVTRDNWPIRALGAHVICLPNRVDAALEMAEGDAPPWDPEAPDV